MDANILALYSCIHIICTSFRKKRLPFVMDFFKALVCRQQHGWLWPPAAKRHLGTSSPWALIHCCLRWDYSPVGQFMCGFLEDECSMDEGRRKTKGALVMWPRLTRIWSLSCALRLSGHGVVIKNRCDDAGSFLAAPVWHVCMAAGCAYARVCMCVCQRDTWHCWRTTQLS